MKLHGSRWEIALQTSWFLEGLRRVFQRFADTVGESRVAACCRWDPLPDPAGPWVRAAGILFGLFERFCERVSRRTEPAWRDSRLLPLLRWERAGWGDVPLRTWGAGLLVFAVAAASVAVWRRGLENIGPLFAWALIAAAAVGLLLQTASPRAKPVPEQSACFRLLRFLIRHPDGEPEASAGGSGATVNPPAVYRLALFTGALLLGGLFGGLPLRDVLLITGGCVFLAALLRHPRFGVYGAAVAFPLLPDLAGLLVILGTSGVGLAWAVLRGRFHLPASPVGVPLTLFMGMLVITTVTSLRPDGSLRDLALHAAGFAFALLIPQVIDRPSRAHRLLWASGLALVVLGGISIGQFVSGVPIDPAWVDPSQQSIETRVFATFGNPNVLAEYLALLLPVFLGVLVVFPRHPAMLAPWIAVTAGGATLLLTFSRGGWLAMGVALAVVGLLRDRRVLGGMVFAAAVGAFLAPASVLSRVASMISLTDSSNAYRVAVWDIALRIIADFWATGIGLGYQVFRLVSGDYSRFLTPYHAHNFYLQSFLEFGLFGFIIVLWLMAGLGKAALRASRAPDRYVAGLGAGLVGSFTAFLVYGLVEHVLYMPKVIFTFWLLVGWTLALERMRADSANDRPIGLSSGSL